MKMSAGKSSGPDPAPLFELAVAFWRSSALFAALELNVFAVLGDRELSTAALAGALKLPERSLKLLLEALAALKLLRKGNGCWRNTELAAAYLIPGKPDYLGEAIMFNARSYGVWGSLAPAVRENAPAMDPEHFLGEDLEATRNFVYGMHGRAQGVARCLVQLLDLSGRKHLLDLGGGPGTYSMLLAERYPELECTILDLPGILAVAEEVIAGSPVHNRLTLRPGNMFTDEFGSGYDVILISGVLHRTEDESTIALLKKAAAALEPAGLLAVSDLFTGREDPGPVLPELFSLHMMLTANEGRSLSLPEMPGILAAAGLRLLKTIAYPPPLPHTLCLAEKAE